MNLLKEGVEFLQKASISHAEIYYPYFFATVMCHAFNLRNKQEEIYFEGGKIPDFRLHIFMVAPPGFSKTYTLRTLCANPRGILCDCGIPVTWCGSMTEAGFVGTVKISEETGEPVQLYGLAKKYKDYIIAVDEFSAITNMMRVEHSLNLDNAMLTALDSGQLVKSLAAGEMKYETNLTLLTGSQPARFDLTSGLGRRFLFLSFIPTAEDLQRLKESRRRARNVRYDSLQLAKIREIIKHKIDKINQIKEITFDDSFDRLADSLDLQPYEEPLFERLAFGLFTAKEDFGESVNVVVDEEIAKLMTIACQWRDDIAKGPEEHEVESIIPTEGISLRDLQKRLLKFGISLTKQSTLITALEKQKRIKIQERGGETWITKL